MAMIDNSKVLAEMNASYNQQFKQTATMGGSSKVITMWYLDDNGFPKATKNLDLKVKNVNNCGLVMDNAVYVLKKANNDKAWLATDVNVGIEIDLIKKDGFVSCDLASFVAKNGEDFAPISTSTNQMLVSNGNGGWEVQNGTQDIYRTWSFFVTSPYSSNVINMKWCGLWKKTKSAKKMPVSIPFKLTIDSTNEYHGTIYFTFVNANGFVNPIIVWEDITPSAKAKAVFEKMQVIMREGSDDTLYCDFWTSSASTASTQWYTISYEISGRFINSDRGGFSSTDKQQINHRLENNQIRDAMGASFLYEHKCDGATPTIEATITHYMKSQTAI